MQFGSKLSTANRRRSISFDVTTVIHEPVNMIELVRFLKQAVEVAHNCEAEHEGSIHVRVSPLWEGEVEFFRIRGPADSQRCYAWIYECDKVHHFITVLASDAINLPEAAVRVGLEMEETISRRKVMR